MGEPSNQPDRLTLNEAAHRLGMSEGQVRRRVFQGHLEGGQEFGRWWYVTRESVEKYLADQAQEAASGQ